MATIELPALYVNNVIALAALSRPLLICRDPGPGETDVPLDTAIALELVDTESSGISRGDTQIWVDGVLAFEGEAAEEIKPGFNGPRADIVETSDTLRLVLDPLAVFESQAEVTIRVVTATNDGQTLDETYSFFAEDLTRPKLVAAQAIGQKSVRLSFDESVMVTSPNGFSVEPLEFPAVSPAVVDAVASGTVLEVRHHAEVGKVVRIADEGTVVVRCVFPVGRFHLLGIEPIHAPGVAVGDLADALEVGKLLQRETHEWPSFVRVR